MLTEIYTDVMSGRSDRRPQLKRLETAAASRSFDVVIVYKLDRLARSTATFYRIASLLSEREIKLQSLTEDLNVNTPEGKAMIGILAIFAEIFSDQLSQRVRGAMAQLATKGQWRTGAKAPIGYRLVKEEGKETRLEAVPEEAESVRFIFDAFLRVRSLRATCEALYAAGIATATGGHWQTETLKYLLRNPVYVGSSAWGKYKGSKGPKRARIATDRSAWVVIEGTHEPIIERQVWDDAQRILDDNKDKHPRQIQARRSYAWNGLLKCSGEMPDESGPCGAAMNNRIRRYKSGGSIREYYCNRMMDAGKSTCPGYGRVSDKFLDWVVVPELDKLLRRVSVEADARTLASAKKKPRASLDPTKRIGALEARRAREKELFRGGFSTFEEMAGNIKKIENEIKALGDTNQAAPPTVLAGNLLSLWADLEPALQGDLLRSFIKWCEVDRNMFRVILRPHPHPEWPETLEIPIVSTRWHPNNRRQGDN